MCTGLTSDEKVEGQKAKEAFEQDDDGSGDEGGGRKKNQFKTHLKKSEV
jgi:hypothetical protein